MRVCQRSRRGRPCSICRRSRRDWRSCRSRPIRPAREKAAPCPELSYYWLSLMIEVHQPVQRQIGLDTIEQVRLFLKKYREAARCDDGKRLADLGFHARNQPLHHRYIAPIDADQHLAFGSPPDHAVHCRRLDRDARQLGGGGDQSFERPIDARTNDSAQISAVGPDMVERRRGAEADDELVLAGLDRKSTRLNSSH